MNDLLKFMTCGSVDDGKSTLIGHMLYDAKLLYTDQEKTLWQDSKVKNAEGHMDYSLLLDGLVAEREQGITIDVAYRFFSTQHRSFIVADTPGHEQYTRNMAVGASFADLAIILVDATRGILPQTRRHVRICALMGIEHFVLALNKMDLVDYAKERYDSISQDAIQMMKSHDVQSWQVIPVSATQGDNVTHWSVNMPWYESESLLSYLEKVSTLEQRTNRSFSMPVQRVSRPHQYYRGLQGQVAGSAIKISDEIMVLPGQEKARIKTIHRGSTLVEIAEEGHFVSIQLDRELDVSRGCVLASSEDLACTDMFTASILWMDEQELIPGRNYLLKIGTKTLTAYIMSIRHRMDINTGELVSTDSLAKNELGQCDVAVSEPMVFERFANNKALGSLILMDRISNMTSACGVIDDVLTRSSHVVWQEMEITRDMRARQKNQVPVTIWFTGLSGSGKSTLANALEKRLVSLGRHTMILDGDNIRHGLNRNLGFGETDRVENIRRVAEVAKLMNDAGLVVLASFISPYERDRELAREILGEHFLEIYLSTSLEECQRRDVKGLYAKAKRGEIPGFTGISGPYEKPSHPDLEIDTGQCSVEEAIDRIEKLMDDVLMTHNGSVYQVEE